jgi:hypothetical protein
VSNATNAKQKPRFIRVVKDGQLWLRDREGFNMIGPFDSWADALAHISAATRADGERDV